MATTNKRIYSMGSRNGIYHFEGCSYTKKMKAENIQHATKANLNWMGWRPCSCCNTMAFRYGMEEGDICHFADEKHMDVFMDGDVLNIKTSVGAWRIVYIPKDQIFILYHGNRNINTGYHRQKDNLTAKTIMDYIEYIYRHDLFRAAEKEGRNQKVDKKYEKSVRRAQQRKSARRIDRLFAKLEADNSEYRRLSYC